MKNYLFLTSYSFLIISYFLIGRIAIGPINIIWVSEILMLIACLFMDRRLLGDRILFLYIIFFFIRIFSESFYGYSDKLFNMMVTSAPSSFVLCWSSAVLMKMKNQMSLNFFIIPFVLIGVLNAVVSFCQAKGIFGTEILLETLHAQNEEEMEFIIQHGDRFGRSVSGIFGTPVRNGHISLLIILSTFLLKGRRLIYFRLFVFALILIGLFFCQQRAAFMLAIIFSTILLSVSLSQNGQRKLLVLVIIFGAIIIPSLYVYIDSLDTRVTDINFDTRGVIYENGLDYISQHLVIGSYYDFSKIAGHAPHNMVLSAFIAGGLIGGSLLMYIVFLQLSMMLKTLKREKTNEALVIECMYLAMLCDSLFHNSGLVEINVPTFLAWGLVLGMTKTSSVKNGFNFNKQVKIAYKSKLK